MAVASDAIGVIAFGEHNGPRGLRLVRFDPAEQGEVRPPVDRFGEADTIGGGVAWSGRVWGLAWWSAGQTVLRFKLHGCG